MVTEFNDLPDARERMEQAQRDSEAHLRLMVNQLPIMLWTTDRALQFTSSSGKGFQAINQSPDALVGQRLYDVLKTNDPKSPAIQGHLQALENKSAVYELDWVDRIYECHVEPLHDESGQILGCIGVALDITERKQAEQNLQRSEKYFRALIENSADGIATYTVDGIVTYVSPGSIRATGYTAEEFLGVDRFNFIHPDDVDQERKEWAALVQEPGAIVISEYRVRRKNGSWLWVERILHNLLSDPNVGAIVANFRNITERKQAEEALRQSEFKYHSIFESVHDIILRKDRHGNILDINRRAEAVLGYTQAELLQVNVFHDLIVPHDAPKVRQVIDDLMKGKNREYDVRWRAKDGHIVFFEVVSTPFYSSNGDFISTICTLRDVTERKQAEQALRQYTERLEIRHEIDEALLNAQSIEGVTMAVLKRVMGLVPSQEAHILLVNFDQRDITVYARVPTIPLDFISGAHVSLDELGDISGVLNRLRQGEVIVTDDIAAALPNVPIIQKWLATGPRTVILAPLRDRGNLFGTFNLSKEGAGDYTPQEIDMVRELADSLAIAITQMRLFEAVSSGRDRLRILSRRLIEVEEDTRRRIARELHDQVGTNLTALGINLNVVQDQLSASEREGIETRLADSLILLDETVDRIRDVITDLHPAVLADYGLEAALRWYAGQVSQRAGLEVKVGQVAQSRYKSPEAETALFRIVQEALNNVVKHAQATQVEITLEQLNKTIRLTIADNGVGFAPLHHNGTGKQTGLGLISMAERAEALGGHMQVKSAIGKGTRIIVEVPY